MKRYVLGFLLSGDMVLLIKKTRPEWQKGKLNGIGGHVEEGETAHEAMVREAQEETGLYVPDWKEFALMEGTGRAGPFQMRVFWAREDRLKGHNFVSEEGEVRFYRESEWKGLPRVDNIDTLLPAALHGGLYLSVEYLGEPQVTEDAEERKEDDTDEKLRRAMEKLERVRPYVVKKYPLPRENPWLI